MVSSAINRISKREWYSAQERAQTKQITKNRFPEQFTCICWYSSGRSYKWRNGINLWNIRLLKRNAYIGRKARYIDLSITKWSSGSRIAKADGAMTLQMALFPKLIHTHFFHGHAWLAKKKTGLLLTVASLLSSDDLLTCFPILSLLTM